MAILRNKSFKGMSGCIDQLVFKQYANGVVVTRKPNMSGIKRTRLQKDCNTTFAAAIAYARSILADPVKKEAVKKDLPKGASVYHTAIKIYYNELARRV